MKEDQAGPSTGGASLFKKRNKARSGGLSSHTSQPAGRLARKEGHDEEEEVSEEEPVSVIRTGGPRSGRRTAGLQQTSSNATGQGSRDRVRAAGFALPSSAIEQSESSVDGMVSSSGYDAASIAALKASTPHRLQMNASQLGHTSSAASIGSEGDDPTEQQDGQDCAFIDSLHTEIPSDAVIAEAKSRRQKAKLALESDAGATQEADFISLRDDHKEQRTESRLQREEDDLGSGEEEFAELTGAAQRIALDKAGIERERQQEQQRRREELMDLDHVPGETTDEGEREWEQAQLQRVNATTKSASGMDKRHGKGRSHRNRPRSPFQPAPIPLASPLPTVTSALEKLKQRQSRLEADLAAQTVLHGEAAKELAQLEDDEQRNRTNTESAAEREAWFRELETFIISMATFLEEKMVALKALEEDWLGHLSLRNSMIQRARMEALTDQISLFYGVPTTSLIPPIDGIEADAEAGRGPIEQGDALSAVRQARRPHAHLALADQLTASDQAAFEIAQAEIVQRAMRLLDDVRAVEYRDPAARTASDDSTSTLHPASLVARFHRWRRLYPQEYGQAWGGLTLASIYDYWIRRSLCGWDAMRLSKQSPNSLDHFPWYQEVEHYSHVALHPPSVESSNNEGPSNGAIGGDDEMVPHLFTNTVLVQLQRLCQARTFDPWSIEDNDNLQDLLEQISYVLEKDQIRFRAVVSSLLACFPPWIDALAMALSEPPALPAPHQHPDAPSAVLGLVHYIQRTLLTNLLGWQRFAVEPGQRRTLCASVNDLIGRAWCPLLDSALRIPTGPEMVRILVEEVLRKGQRLTLLNADVTARLQSML